MAATAGTTLVGREQELAALCGALGRLARRRPALVSVCGEPGIGKSALLEALAERADAAGHLVLEGRGTEFERDVPFGIWVDAVDDFAGTLGADRLARLTGGRAHELSWVLPAVAVPPGAASPALADERYRAHRAVRALLEGLAARRPVVVALDDAQWADPASLELIAHLLRHPPRGAVLLAVAFRSGGLPTETRAALDAAIREGSAVELAPAPLSAEQAKEVLGAELDELLYRESGGNPFYLAELARTSASVARAGDGTTTASGLPPAVAAALGQELAALAPPARTLAQGAAVAGEPVDLDLALAASALEEDAGLAALDELLAAGLLQGTDVPRRYRFRHPIVRRAAYEAAGERRRLEAHARLAAALAARGAGPVDRARHIEQSARPGDREAVGLLAKAASEVAARAPASAARWLQAALRLLGAGPDVEEERLGLLVPLAVAQAATGELEQAVATMNELLEVLPPETSEVRSRLIAACAASENILGRHAAAHARLLRALDEEPELGAGAATLEAELAADALHESDFAAMRRWAERAYATATGAGDTGQATVAAALRCYAEYNLGETAAAARARAEAATGVDAMDDEELAARLAAPHYLGWAEFFCERYDDAIRHLRRGVEVARATGQGQFLISMTVGLALALEVRGHVREGVEAADAAVESARLAGNPQMLSWALTAQAWTTASYGDHAGAATAASEAIDCLKGLDESVLTRFTRVMVAAVWVDLREAERCLEQLTGEGTDLVQSEPSWRVWLCADLARAEQLLDRRAVAQRWLDRGYEALGDLELPLTAARLHRSHAELVLAEGEADEAAGLALRSVASAELVGAVVEAGRARIVAGRALARAGERERAVAELARAETELAACEARRLRDEAARELRRLGRRVATPGRRAAGDRGLGALSGREREIADLVAEGRTNKEIGATLFLADKTVESHLTNVFSKLEVGSRAEVAALVGREVAAVEV